MSSPLGDFDTEELHLLLHVCEQGTLRVQLEVVKQHNRPAISGTQPEATAQQPAAVGPGPAELRHLQFVASRSRAVVEQAGRLYNTLRTSALPESSSFSSLEHHVTQAFLAPLAAAGQSALQTLDSRLDALLVKLAPYSPTHKDSPDAWAQAVNKVPGATTLCRSLEPAARLGLAALYTLHDHLVPSPYYKAAVDLTTGSLSYASTLPPYKLASHFIYPIVRPVADVALNSEAMHTVLDYWKPTSKGPLPTSNGSSSPNPNPSPSPNPPST